MHDSRVLAAFSRLPRAARLLVEYDVRSLEADLRTLRQFPWRRRHRYPTGWSVTTLPEGWHVLPLRSIGADPQAADAGGPARHDFADTRWLAHAPYLASLLESLPAEKRAVRLMALGPGAAAWPHHDPKQGLAWGTVRLHVPISTPPKARLLIEEEPQAWDAGTLWYGDFTRVHRAVNPGPAGTQVHLVIDLLPSPGLLELFPAEFRTPDSLDLVVFARPRVPLREGLLDGTTRFDLPESFLDWEEKDGAFLRPQRRVAATAVVAADGAVLRAEGWDELGLTHLGNGEFRFAGWTEERTLRLPGPQDAPVVVLRTRRGHQVRELAVPARHG